MTQMHLFNLIFFKVRFFPSLKFGLCCGFAESRCVCYGYRRILEKIEFGI